MLRICIVIGKMDSGGKKNLVMEYYRHIDKSKIQFDFICDDDSQAIPEQEINALGGNIYKIKPYQNIFMNMFDIYNICKKNKYPIVHSYNSTMNVFSLFAAKLAGVPIRISESISMAHSGEFKTYIKKMLLPFSKLFATHFMACGIDCGQWQFGKSAYENGKIAIFKTCIDTEFNSYNEELRNLTRTKYCIDDKFVVGFIGRFVKQKNPLFLLDIFFEIYKREPNALLLLIGDGELKAEMINKIEVLGIEKQVMYLGRREDIQQFYNAMDCFLLPSLYEGLPVVGLEAQCCGLPVFFSSEITNEASSSDLSHFINLVNGPELWAESILKNTFKNIGKRCSRNYDLVISGYDSKNEAARLADFYLNCIREKR